MYLNKELRALLRTGIEVMGADPVQAPVAELKVRTEKILAPIAAEYNPAWDEATIQTQLAPLNLEGLQKLWSATPYSEVKHLWQVVPQVAIDSWTPVESQDGQHPELREEILGDTELWLGVSQVAPAAAWVSKLYPEVAKPVRRRDWFGLGVIFALGLVVMTERKRR